MNKYPTLPEIRQLLRYNLTKPLRVKIINAFIVGSEAKGTAISISDLDIAVIIPKLKKKHQLNSARTIIHVLHLKIKNQNGTTG